MHKPDDPVQMQGHTLGFILNQAWAFLQMHANMLRITLKKKTLYQTYITIKKKKFF